MGGVDRYYTTTFADANAALVHSPIRYFAMW